MTVTDIVMLVATALIVIPECIAMIYFYIIWEPSTWPTVLPLGLLTCMLGLNALMLENYCKRIWVKLLPLLGIHLGTFICISVTFTMVSDESHCTQPSTFMQTIFLIVSFFYNVLASCAIFLRDKELSDLSFPYSDISTMESPWEQG